MPTKLLRQIKNSLPELRKSERAVGEFVLEDPKSIINMKTAEASEKIGISEPTLIRFCKALGFSGCLLYTSPSPRDATLSRMPSSA